MRWALVSDAATPCSWAAVRHRVERNLQHSDQPALPPSSNKPQEGIRSSKLQKIHDFVPLASTFQYLWCFYWVRWWTQPLVGPQPERVVLHPGVSRPEYLTCRIPGTASQLVQPYQFPSDWGNWDGWHLVKVLHIVFKNVLYLIKLSWIWCIVQNYLAYRISYITISERFVCCAYSHACFVSPVLYYTKLS